MINYAIKGDAILDFLKGKVKRAETKEFFCVNGISELNKHFIKHYDIYGNRVESENFDFFGNLTVKVIANINGKGQKVGFASFDEYGSKTGNCQYKFDDKDRVEAMYIDGDCDEIYVYDNNGRIAEVFNPTIGVSLIYEYDKRGLVIRQIDVDDENSFHYKRFQKTKRAVFTFENDERGNILQTKVLLDPNAVEYISQKSKINSYGDEIELITFTQDRTIYSELFYNYNYDYKNNWILQETKNKNGKVIEVTKRVITYW